MQLTNLVSTLYEMVQDGRYPADERPLRDRAGKGSGHFWTRSVLTSHRTRNGPEIVEKRNEFITAGKREAEAIRKQAEELARQKGE